MAEIDKQQRINLTMKTSAVVEADKQYSERLQLLREVPTGLRANIMGSALARAGITKSAFVDLSQVREGEARVPMGVPLTCAEKLGDKMPSLAHLGRSDRQDVVG